MKIQQWIKLTGAKKTVLARLIGISNPRMTRILKHGLVPHPEEMVKFCWVSLGTVRPENWYDLATVPPDLQRLFDHNRVKNHASASMTSKPVVRAIRVVNKTAPDQ